MCGEGRNTGRRKTEKSVKEREEVEMDRNRKMNRERKGDR